MFSQTWGKTFLFEMSLRASEPADPLLAVKRDTHIFSNSSPTAEPNLAKDQSERAAFLFPFPAVFQPLQLVNSIHRVARRLYRIRSAISR